jgi:hypothetical protein
VGSADIAAGTEYPDTDDFIIGHFATPLFSIEQAFLLSDSSDHMIGSPSGG